MLDEQTPAEAGTSPESAPADTTTASDTPTDQLDSRATSEAPSEPAAKPARKRAPRKSAAKKAAAPEQAPEPPLTDPDAGPGVEADAAPAPARKRAPRKSAAKKAAAAPAAAPDAGDTPGETGQDGAPVVRDEGEQPAARPAKRTTKRATKKSTAAPLVDDSAAAATSAVEQPPLGSEEAPDTAPTAKAAPPAITPLFQPPDPSAARPTRKRATKKAGPPKPAAETAPTADVPTAPDAEEVEEVDLTALPADEPADGAAGTEGTEGTDDEGSDDDSEEGEGGARRRRRRGGRRRRKPSGEGGESGSAEPETEADADSTESKAGPPDESQGDSEGEGSGTSRRRRRRRRSGDGDDDATDDAENTVTRVRKPRNAEDEITGFTGSTRLEAKKQRRREGREAGRRRAPIVSEAEFLARRESVDRKMVIRQRGDLTQIAVLEDKVLVEHYVARESQTSLIGNVYLGRVQNVLPSMEAAFIDIGKGRNAVLYAGEVNWDALGAKDGKQRKIEQVLKSGQSVLVQVSKDPIGHKGARLTSQISLPGRFLVYVPDGTTSGISRKLPDNERNRLKSLLKEIVPDTAGVIVRTAAEGASESELTRDVERLKALWEDIESKVEGGNAPQLLYGEPDLTLKVVRDLFTEDIAKLVISGDEAWEMVQQYVEHVAPDLADRLERHDDAERDAFAEYRIDEQIAKGLDRKVWLPSGGSLVIDRTEAMTVVDVNTGKFTGSGGNLEETVTKNNLEAAEEIVRQLRLRDIGGIIVVDFIDMVLENNRDLVLRRLIECLGRDRTRHQVAEVTSLGLVQMTRKRIGTGLLEAFSESCEACQGRGLIVHQEPVEQRKRPAQEDDSRRGRRGRGRKGDDQADDSRGGKESAKESGGRDGRDGKETNGGGGRRPTPAEFAAMVRSDAAEAAAENAEETTPDVTAPEVPAPEVTAPEVTASEVTASEVTTPEVTAPVTEPTVEPTALAEAEPPTEPETEVEAGPQSQPEPEPEPEPEAPPVPTGPRIVTSVRRVGARRAAGPPAPTSGPTADGTGGAGDPGGSVDGTGGSESAAGPDQVPDEAVHVPVKKKGSRKR